MLTNVKLVGCMVPLIVVLILMASGVTGLARSWDKLTLNISVHAGTWTPRPASKVDGCRSRRGLPDRRCTPGAIDSQITKDQVCVLDGSLASRRVASYDRHRVLAAYNKRRSRYQVDLLIPVQLGGEVTRANMWPQTRNAKRRKDRAERRALRAVCAGEMGLRHAQFKLAVNWKSLAAAQPRR